MGSHQDDWQIVAQWYSRFPDIIIPFFGLHPWYAHKRTDTWLQELRALLEKYPNAMIGEIGLDKKAVDLSTNERYDDDQWKVFEEQLDLAVEYQRVTSIHCVCAWGPVMNALRARIKNLPNVCLHSYGGTKGTVDNLVRVSEKACGRNKFYFGFSSIINLRSPKTPQVIAAVPDEHLLLESDLDTWKGQRKALLHMVKVMANAKKLSEEEILEITSANALKAFSLSA